MPPRRCVADGWKCAIVDVDRRLLAVSLAKAVFLWRRGTDPMNYRYFDVEQRGKVTQICLAATDFFDTSCYAELRDELVALVERERPHRLLVDLSLLRYCSTAVMGALVDTGKRLAALPVPGRMKLCGLHPVVREAFRRLRLDGRVFDIHETAEEAVAAF
jgi:anti-anti-sigma regulatory factor